MITAGTATSKEKDSYQAGNIACKNALQNAGIDSADLIITFSSVAYNQTDVVRGIRDAGKNAPLVGCSSAGEITSEGPVSQSVVVMAIKAENIHFTTGLGLHIDRDARMAGQALARELKQTAPQELKTVIIFPDVLAGNGADVVSGVQDVLGQNFPIMGGAAGDDFKFEKTYQYRDGVISSGSVAGVGLSGNFTFGAGVKHGWVPIGLPMTATKSKGSILYELDGKPAVSIYEDYFGERAEDMRKEPLARMAITYPLGIKFSDSDEYLIRDPITVNKDGSITCAAEIPEGSEIRLMIGSKDKAINAAEDAAKRLVEDFKRVKKMPALLLVFNCIAREKLFGTHAKDEINKIMDIVGRETPMVGFYTYGEQAPIGGETQNSNKIHSLFYNETVVLFGIG